MSPEQHITRRRAIAIGAAGLATAYVVPKLLIDGSENAMDTLADITAPTASAATDCVLAREVTEGPYYLDGVMSRRNITEGKRGVPLQLRLSVVDATSCSAIKGADVEIWHADAGGEYSGFDGSGGGETSTRYLRGHQLTNAQGVAIFNTIFPGWYPGRSPHIHVKVHVGGQEVHTGQIFFTTALAKRVYGSRYYRSRGNGWRRNSSDMIYADGGGSSAVARVRRRSGKSGYLGYLTMGMLGDN